MKYPFSEAIINNIKRTYTYAYVKGAHNYLGSPDYYNPFQFFDEYLAFNPFKAFMELDKHGFKKTLNTLNRYNIPYTPEQEYQAKIYYEVTKQMMNERSDAVRKYTAGDLTATNIVKLNPNYLLTTQDTLDVARFLKQLPKNK
ncbi:hypothetical protein CVR96_26200, partial [Salmonella enterica subsp. enterica serovar Typhimurium]|uniref:hypothetical protein n=1 Tax=Salmonella enterica TaxID=28901 RepID=UPI000CC04470